MPLLYFLGVSPLGKYFSVGFCFLSGEKEEDYEWAIQQFTERILPDTFDEPGYVGYLLVVISDNDTALKTVLRREFPDTTQLLCIWHINQNVLTHAQKVWISTDVWLIDEEKEEIITHRTEFIKVWNEVSLIFFFF
jgi:hypothetical protein